MSAPFDGSTTYLARSAALTGVSSSDAGTISAWVKPDADTGVIFAGEEAGGNRVDLSLSSGTLVVTLRNSSDTTLWNATTTTDLNDSAWHHLGLSWDLSATAAAIYIDRTSDQTDATGPTSGTVDYEGATSWNIGESSSTFFSGRMWDFAFWPGVYIDLDDEHQRIKLISADGLGSIENADSQADLYGPRTIPGAPKPVGYSQLAEPAVLFSGAWHKNRGTGGVFTLQGSWEDVSSDDPDIPNFYRLASRPGWGTPERWFDSEKSGMSAPRSETFIERRQGHPDYGKRLRTKDEMDEQTRDLWPYRERWKYLLNPTEDDSIDRRR